MGVSSQDSFMGRRQAGRCVFARSEVGRFKDNQVRRRSV